jgi:hypothetical protein
LVQVCEALHNGELFLAELDQKGSGGGETKEGVCQSGITSIAESREDQTYPLSFPRPPVEPREVRLSLVSFWYPSSIEHRHTS